MRDFTKLDPLTKAAFYVGAVGLMVMAVWMLFDPQARALAGW
jgi:hypothetical protein